MADSELDILVRTIADTHGSEAVSASLAKVKLETQTLAKGQANLTQTLNQLTANLVTGRAAVEKLTIAKKELKEVGRGLATQFPIVGRAIGLLTNPLSLMAGVLASSIGLFIKLRNEAKALAADIDFTPMAERLSGIADAASIAGDSFETFAETVEKLNRLQREAEGQHSARSDQIKAEAEAIEDLAESMGVAGKEERQRASEARLIQAEKDAIRGKELERIDLITEQTVAEKALLNAEKDRNDANLKLADIKGNIAAIDEKEKKGRLRPDETQARTELRGAQTEAELSAAEADARFQKSSGRVGEARGRVSAADQNIASRRAAVNASEQAASAQAFFTNRGEAISGAMGGFFDSGGTLSGAGGRSSATMLAELKATALELMQSRMETQEILALVAKMFRDGVVTPQELAAVKNQIKTANNRPVSP